MEDCAQFGWAALAKMLGISKRSCMRRKNNLQEAGVIFFLVRGNARGRKYKGMFFFPSIIKAYLIKNTMEGKLF